MSEEEVHALALNVLHHGWGWQEDLKKLEDVALARARCERLALDLTEENERLIARILELQPA